jgi:MoaD family protein
MTLGALPEGMQLELRFFATFRATVGQKVIEREFPDDTTVGDVLWSLESEYPDMDDRLLDESGVIREQLSILKNGQEVVHMQGAETPMEDGDRLSVFPPVAGGNDAAEGGDNVDRVHADDESATEHVEKSYRGISKRLAVHYLQNLGGELVAGEAEDSETARVAAEGWGATLSAEKVAIAGGTMRLTEVSIVFEGDSDVLPSLVERFSQKAMRAGG